MKTYKVTVYETTKEFFDHFPGESTEAYLVIDGNRPRFSGEGALAYEFGEDVTKDSLIGEMFDRAGVRVYLA